MRRSFFLIQGLACFFWWAFVFSNPEVQRATLGGLNPIAWFLADLALFGGASLLLSVLPSRSTSIRTVLGVLLVWSVFVTAILMTHAMITGSGGLGVVLMACAISGTLVCGIPLAFDPIWIGRMLPSLLRVKPARSGGSVGTNVAHTLIQIVVFWSLLLEVVPFGIRALEHRWGLAWPAIQSPVVAGIGGFLFAVMGGLGIWAGYTMATLGSGTPLPSNAANRLVIAGPYRFVRNPMAITGISQGVASGMILGSWMVVLYAVAGSAVWNCLVRPYEEDDLRKRFGSEFEAYRKQVRCWIPGKPFTETAGRPAGEKHRE